MNSIEKIYRNIIAKEVRHSFGKFLTLSWDELNSLLNVYAEIRRIDDDIDSIQSLACSYIYRLIRIEEVLIGLWEEENYETRMELAGIFNEVMTFEMRANVMLLYTKKEVPITNDAVQCFADLREDYPFVARMTALSSKKKPNKNKGNNQ